MFKQIENQIEQLQYQYIDEVIKKVWEKDPDDYWIEITNHFVNLSDFYLSFDDIKDIAKYKIPENIVYEYLDSTHLNFESEDMNKFNKWLKEIKSNWNLVMFYKYKLANS